MQEEKLSDASRIEKRGKIENKQMREMQTEEKKMMKKKKITKPKKKTSRFEQDKVRFELECVLKLK